MIEIIAPKNNLLHVRRGRLSKALFHEYSMEGFFLKIYIVSLKFKLGFFL